MIPDTPSNAASGMGELADDLRSTTEEMACACSAPMELWQKHSTAVLRAADALSAKNRELAALDDELAGERWHADEAARQRDVWKDRATTAERARDEALSALREKEERVRVLEEALRPFANEGEDWGMRAPDHAVVVIAGPCCDEPVDARFTVGDLRRARSVLTPVSREQRGEEA